MSQVEEQFSSTSALFICVFRIVNKGRFQKRFSGIRPLRGYPPLLLTENQSEKKKVFFLSGKGGYPPPLNGKSAKLFRENFS